MKKTLSLILILLLLLGFCACEGDVGIEEGHASEKIDLEEAVHFLASLEMPKADVPESSMIAPAQGTGNELFGYINLQGEWVIEPKYSGATFFEEDMAMVLENYEDYLLIDREGTTVLSGLNRKTMDQIRHYSQGAAALSLDTACDQKYVYAGTDGSVLFSAAKLPKVSRRSYKNPDYFAYASGFTGGRAVVMRLMNSGITDKRGPEKAYVIDRSGQILASLPEGLDPQETGIDDNGNIIVKNAEQLYGLCSADGELLIEPRYRRLSHCDGQLYLACGENGFFGYVDANGNTVIDFQYIKALPFSECYAAVYDGEHWGFINELGECAIEFVFDDVAALKAPCTDSSIGKAAFCEGLAAVCKNGYWALITPSELPVMCLAPERIAEDGSCPYKTIRNGYVSYCVVSGGDELYGLATVKGEEVIAPSFGNIGMFN